MIEPDEIARKTGYSRPHTVHCGPDGIYVTALGNPDGDGPGGIFVLDHDDFSVKGAWEVDRGPQELAYDFWWHLGYDTRDHERVGHAEHGRGRRRSASCCSATSTATSCTSGTSSKRRHLQEIDLGAEHQMVLELRPAHDPDKAYGFVGVVISTADLSASVWLWERGDDGSVSRREGHHDPGRAGRGRPAAAGSLKPFGAVPPLVTDIALSVDDRSLLRLLLGHRRAQALRRQRPAQPARDRLGAPRRDRRAGAPHPAARPAQRRPADGRGRAATAAAST